MKLTLKEVRQLRKMSIETLAGYVEVSSATIKNWESGRVSILNAKFQSILLLSHALQVSLEEIVKLSEWKPHG